MPVDKFIKTYKDRIDSFNQSLSKIKSNLIWISILRFVFFILAIVVFIKLIKSFSWLMLVCFVGMISVFIFHVIFYIKRTEILNHIKNLVQINNNEIKALQNDYSSFSTGKEFIDREHYYSYDLDLFGEGSIYQYLNRTVTLVGADLLAKRLTNTNDARRELILSHQEAITEIAKKIDWRQNFMATGYIFKATNDDNKNIDKWLDKPIYFIKRAVYKILVVFLPVITLTFLALLMAGVSHYSWFILFALSQLFFASVLLRRTSREQSMVSEELRILKIYSRLIRHIENENFNSMIFSDLQNALKVDQTNAQKALKKLIKIIDAFDTRLNIFMGIILNATLMWDLLSIMRLERWKLKYGQNIKKWIDVIAEFDFYISAGTFYYNNPGYAFPKIIEDKVLIAEELGHPLIPLKKRVNNDFTVEKPSEIEIITGANMAGKSTFLRTVGVNLILALNGFPVCAKNFEFRVMEIFSGMRTADSLKENESYFYAELKRLKYIVDKLNDGKLTFLLLDEILKGTNSVDKAKGSWKFVENLIKLKATGIIATHDLSLCEMEKEYPENIENKCFEVDIDHNKINFDYKLRPGITKNMNASLLMQQMGIFSN